jgi:hypothetical protein
MSYEFEPLSLDRRAAYLERFARCPEKASDYSFANIWGWAEEYGLEWSWGESHVWLRQTKPELLYWAPVGPWLDVDWSKCPRLTAGGMTITRAPEQLARLWSAAWPGMELREARGHWDYLYSAPELIALKGNKYHKKKNHLNQFKKQFAFEYRSFEADCVEGALELQAEWRQWHEQEGSPALKAEDNAIARVLKDWDQLPGLMGSGLYIDGQMVAYTVAEPLSADSLVIHFEKGKPGVRGVYQAINQMFLEREANGFSIVNREQDLDDENLRYAKMTYHPSAFLKKYAVTIP